MPLLPVTLWLLSATIPSARGQPLDAPALAGGFTDPQGRELRLAAGADGATLYFELQVPLDAGAVRLTGVVAPVGQAAWTAEAAAIRQHPEGDPPGALLLEVRDADHILVSASSGEHFDASLVRSSPESPAHAPMRALLAALPSTAFDDTEEGLAEADLVLLATIGQTEFFRLDREERDFLRVTHPAGRVDLRRLPWDGEAILLLCATTNRQVQTLSAWRFGDQGAQPVPRAELLPDAGDFLVDDGLDPDFPGVIRIRRLASDGSEVDTRRLDWNGQRFVAPAD